MSGFNLDDYVDVAERIRLFYAKYPDGRLVTVEHGVIRVQEQLVHGENPPGSAQVGFRGREFVWCRAHAYRSADDQQPCSGTAWEPIPGATPYTRDSELMNAETAAWGRAIIAAGIPSKKIASAQEVRNRQDNGEQPKGKTKPELLAYLSDILVALNTQGSGTDWTEKARAFSREHFETTSSKDLTKAQLESLVNEAEKWLAHLETESVPFG